jgi:hypothetical protein
MTLSQKWEVIQPLPKAARSSIPYIRVYPNDEIFISSGARALLGFEKKAANILFAHDRSAREMAIAVVGSKNPSGLRIKANARGKDKKIACMIKAYFALPEDKPGIVNIHPVPIRDINNLSGSDFFMLKASK